MEALLSRRFDKVKLIVIYIEGMSLGDHMMMGAVGVDIGINGSGENGVRCSRHLARDRKRFRSILI